MQEMQEMVKNPPANAGDARDAGSVPGSGRPPGEGNGNPLQYSCLETPVDGEAWWATAYGVTKSWTRLSDFTSLYGPPEERKLPLPSYRTVRRMYPGSTVAKNPAANAGDAGDVGLIPALERSPGRRKWQPPPVFLPGEFHGRRSLADGL